MIELKRGSESRNIYTKNISILAKEGSINHCNVLFHWKLDPCFNSVTININIMQAFQTLLLF